MNMDFAKNQKTITGLALMLLPFIVSTIGIDISEDTATQIIAQSFNIFGAVLALYGLVMKLVRFIQDKFK